MAVAVVDRLEPFEIEIGDRERRAALAEGPRGGIQPLEQEDAVGKIGQRVVRRAVDAGGHDPRGGPHLSGPGPDEKREGDGDREPDRDGDPQEVVARSLAVPGEARDRAALGVDDRLARRRLERRRFQPQMRQRIGALELRERLVVERVDEDQDVALGLGRLVVLAAPDDRGGGNRRTGAAEKKTGRGALARRRDRRAHDGAAPSGSSADTGAEMRSP